MKGLGRLTGVALLALAGCLEAPEATREPIRVALTFDDGVRDHWTIAAKMLEERGWRGTFCIVNDWIGKDRKMSWDEVRDLVRRGHEIAVHTVSHPALGSLAKRGKLDEVRRQIAESRDDIARRTGFTPRLLCLPGGSDDEKVREIARSEGLVTMDPARDCFGAFGGTDEWYAEWVKSGRRRADALTHGICPEGGGWKPFKSVAEFKATLDRMAELEREGKVIVTDYDGMRSDCALRAKAWPRHGSVAISFDDRNFGDWERAFPLFARYGASATFFACGEIGTNEIAFARKALAAGFEFGLHGLNHMNADEAVAKLGADGYWRAEVAPQLDACRAAGIPVFSFAYPNCRHNAETDALFFGRGFTKVRGSIAGVKGPNPYDPKGVKLDQWKPVATFDPLFVPATARLSGRNISNVIMGENYHTDIEDILRAMGRAGERAELLSIVSHGISPDAKGISMKTEWLERMLSSANELGVIVRGVR